MAGLYGATLTDGCSWRYVDFAITLSSRVTSSVFIKLFSSLTATLNELTCCLSMTIFQARRHRAGLKNLAEGKNLFRITVGDEEKFYKTDTVDADNILVAGRAFPFLWWTSLKSTLILTFRSKLVHFDYSCRFRTCKQTHFIITTFKIHDLESGNPFWTCRICMVDLLVSFFSYRKYTFLFIYKKTTYFSENA